MIPYIFGIRRLICLIGLLLLIKLIPSTSAISFEKLQAGFAQKYGANAGAVFTSWMGLVEGIKDSKSDEKLKRINEYFNRKILWADDQKVWGQLDYWATPMETLAKATGDCEDFAIAKYFTLLAAGIPVNKLRLVYVKAKNGNTPNGGSADQAHMVMAYYPAPDAEPMILDNLITDIRPASRRPDLEPVFSFNSEGVYAGAAGKEDQSASRLSKWQELLQRSKTEGFD